MIDLLFGDCLDRLKEIKSDSIDAIVTDPPYELGFMGKGWDSSGIANNVDLWRECLRVLKPGGHLLSFGGTRTYHRMACAIEDAGFDVRDMIEWVYGSGFPKSLNIGKAVDKLQGNEREKIGEYKTHDIRNNGLMDKKGGMTVTETKGTSEWEGWGTALKPAHEPICMARKPLSEKTVAENCLKWGTGGINIDESRVEFDGTENLNATQTTNNLSKVKYFENERRDFEEPIKTYKDGGRFPANLIHDNSEEVRECFPNENERFFKSIIYQAKASKSERNKGCESLERGCNHPTVKPIALMEYLITMVTPKGGTVLDPFMGSGSTGVAASQNGYGFIGIEMDASYFEIAKKRIGVS